MPIASLTNLITKVERRADIGTTSTDTFITNDDIRTWLRASMQDLMGRLVYAYGEGHFSTTQTITTSAGDATYSQNMGSQAAGGPSAQVGLLDDIFRIISLRVTLDNERVEIERATEAEIDMENPQDASRGWSIGRIPKYRYREFGDDWHLDWTRTPQAVHTVTIHYVPFFLWTGFDTPTNSTLLADSPTYDTYNGWDEWVVLDCVAKCQEWQDLPAETVLMTRSRRDALWEVIKSQANRRQAQPPRIQRRWRMAHRRRVNWLTD